MNNMNILLKIMRLFELLLQILLVGFINAAQPKHGYPEKCGNVTIPYPFGTKEGRYLDKSFYVECDSTTQIPRLHATSMSLPNSQSGHLEVLEIKIDGEIRVTLPIAYGCYSEPGEYSRGSNTAVNTTRFPFSSTRNRFTGVGCDTQAEAVFLEPSVNMKCQTSCDLYGNVQNGSCLGTGCCQSTIPQGMTQVGLIASTINKHRSVWNFSKCDYAFIVEEDMYKFSSSDFSMKDATNFSVVLDWSVDDMNCEEAQKNKTTYSCQENSVCYNGENGLTGYRCRCSEGYSGNPYIPDGCQDIDECEAAELNDCLPGRCQNKKGSYTCACPEGFQGDGKNDENCTHNDPPLDKKGIIKGMSAGVVGAAVVMIFLYWGVKKRAIIQSREDFFKQNGGIILQKLLSVCEDPINKAKIFTEKELKKATNNFNEANIIGQGGYGTVYKGSLANKTMVAIKKSKVIDQSQIKQFVNEVVILSQINHPNIVKLLGCCLETHVPLLVYEYITNKTLCHHIHIEASLTLERRLKIAVETAEALAYMHSTTHIIHRDVKPSNILLNDEFMAKVSDFGISRYIPSGQTHLSTFAKGTIGYIDPEYFCTGKLTENSDVYSFGAVLIELLTGTKIHSLEIPQNVYKGAAAYFNSLLEENALIQVLDDQLKRDEYADMVKCVAKIAIKCLDLEGKTRPAMIEVKQELEQLKICFVPSVEPENVLAS